MGIDSIVRIILSMGLPCCLLALGVFLTFRILDFADMTAEGSMLIGGAICGLLITKGAPAILATFAGMLAGGLCGAVTGVLNRILKIPKLLSGIITMTACLSLALLIFGAANNQMFAAKVDLSDCTTIFSFLDPKVFHGWQEVIVTGVIAVVIICIVYFFFGTEYGMAIRATGVNERMAKSQGINTTVTTIVCVSISNSLIGLAGSLFAQVNADFEATSATGFLIVGLASILIGETVFGKRSFKNSLISICLGSILYFTIITVATETSEFWKRMSKLLYAILIVLALCLPMAKAGIMKLIAKRKKEGESNVGA